MRLLDGTRDVQQVIDESGLVEFEVGKALYGLITAGFAHRVGTSAAVAPKVNDSRVEEHRNLGIAFYKTGMLDEALREFRRVSDLRADRRERAVLPGSHRAAAGDDGRRRWRRSARRSRRAGPRRPRCTTWVSRSSGWAGSTRPKAACADAAGRARDDARIMLGWSVVALKRGDFSVAQGRLARAQELLNGRPAPALWYWAATLASAGLDDNAAALEAARGRRYGLPRQRRSAEQSGRAAGAGRRRGRRGDGAARGARRGCLAPPDLQESGDILYRNGRYDEAREAYERAAKLAPDLGDDLYFKLGNIAYKKRDRDRARSSWGRATELNPGTSSPGPTSRCWTSRRDGHR